MLVFYSNSTRFLHDRKATEPATTESLLQTNQETNSSLNLMSATLLSHPCASSLVQVIVQRLYFALQLVAFGVTLAIMQAIGTFL
jgi:hypothetical protein